MFILFWKLLLTDKFTISVYIPLRPNPPLIVDIQKTYSMFKSCLLNDVFNFNRVLN